MGQGCTRCLRVCLLLSSTIFLLIGDVILGVGVYFSLSDGQRVIQELRQTLPGQFFRFQAALIGLGSVIVLVSFCACAGVVLRNKCALVLYTVLSGLLFLCCSVCAIALAVSSVSRALQSEVETSLRRSYGNTSLVTYAVDNVQAGLGCCGWQLTEDAAAANATAPADKCGWFAATAWHGPNCPQSCCPAGASSCKVSGAYKSCFSALKNFHFIAPLVLFSGMGVSFIHMLCALALVLKLKKERVTAI